MTTISQKCQYALRAMFELAKRGAGGPTSAGEIAAAQEIPPRFLELILAEAGRAGLVRSRRGAQGGYTLAAPPREMTVGQVIRAVEGPLAPVGCRPCGGDRRCRLEGRCAFVSIWKRAADAMANVYDETTLADLVRTEQALIARRAPDYTI
jgi:Rrf2 family protein